MLENCLQGVREKFLENKNRATKEVLWVEEVDGQEI